MNLRRNPEIETKLLPDGHAVLFSKQSNWAHTITPLAAVAWEFCDGSHTTSEISKQVAKIADTNDVSADIESVVTELIQQFIESGLLCGDDSRTPASP
ncbi:MAG TPA: PqqD family protein [Planktothrix sp.]|jgi:hypothetical protein